MTIRRASCRCGQLTAAFEGEPVRVSVCHCNACKLRTGTPFGAQAGFPVGAVTFSGKWNIWERTAHSGAKAWHRWCPKCGGTIGYSNEGSDDIAIALGAIVDGPIPTPSFSVYENRKLPWVEIVGADIDRD